MAVAENGGPPLAFIALGVEERPRRAGLLDDAGLKPERLKRGDHLVAHIALKLGASVRVLAADGRDTTYAIEAEDGYLAEWRALAQALSDGVPVEYDELLDDVRYGLRLAEDAAALVEKGA